MAIKDILVLLDTGSQAAGPYAVSFASTFEARLTAASVVVDPTTIIGFADAPPVFLTSALEEARATAQKLLETFATTVQGSGITLETEPVEAVAGMTGRAVGPLARHFDLTIIEQPHPDIPGERNIVIEAAVFDSGRPVLVVPYIHTAPLRLENVLVAWDGSATAARALGDALRLLERAKRVQVVTVADAADVEMPGDRIIRHLARHGLQAEFHRVPSAGDIASTLLSHAFDSGADLMVMGSYGHSRLREFILGGATRGMLEAMTLPVLMSH